MVVRSEASEAIEGWPEKTAGEALLQLDPLFQELQVLSLDENRVTVLGRYELLVNLPQSEQRYRTAQAAKQCEDIFRQRHG